MFTCWIKTSWDKTCNNTLRFHLLLKAEWKAVVNAEMLLFKVEYCSATSCLSPRTNSYSSHNSSGWKRILIHIFILCVAPVCRRVTEAVVWRKNKNVKLKFKSCTCGWACPDCLFLKVWKPVGCSPPAPWVWCSKESLCLKHTDAFNLLHTLSSRKDEDISQESSWV